MRIATSKMIFHRLMQKFSLSMLCRVFEEVAAKTHEFT